jgi:hypothetical protein
MTAFGADEKTKPIYFFSVFGVLSSAFSGQRVWQPHPYVFSGWGWRAQ